MKNWFKTTAVALHLMLVVVMVFNLTACNANHAPLSTEGPENQATVAEADSSSATEAPTDPTAETETPANTEPTEPVSLATTPTETTLMETTPLPTVSSETEPDETVPLETEPEETAPAETEPAETDPPATEGNSDNESNTDSGYPNDPDTCSHKRLKVVEARQPTPEQDGMILMRCSDCGYELRTEQKYTPPEETEPDETEPAQIGADPGAVAAAIVKVINEYRASEGSTQLTYLPGMSNVAQYRSGQLVYNFAHDTSDMRAAAAYFQYGELVDMTIHGYDASENYYRTDSQEAIAMYQDLNMLSKTAEDIGYTLAKACKESASHWIYVSSSEYSFIGVGCTYVAQTSSWYCCIMVGRVNYG